MKETMIKAAERFFQIREKDEVEYEYVWTLLDSCQVFYDKLCDMKFGNEEIYNEILRIENDIQNKTPEENTRRKHQNKTPEEQIERITEE